MSFWIVYILTRPLGASIGDYLSQPIINGGLGLGPNITSIIFLVAILLTIVYLSISKKDRTNPDQAEFSSPIGTNTSKWQLIFTILFFSIFLIGGYFLKEAYLNEKIKQTNTENSGLNINSKATKAELLLGDLSKFKAIVSSTMDA